MSVPSRQNRLAGRFAFVDGIHFTMPVDSTESSAVIAAFPIDWEAARRLIPPGDVHPFRLWRKGLLVVTVVDYRKTDIGAYIEYSIAIACTKGARPGPPLLPAVFQGIYGTGQYVHDLPVSSEVSVKGGKGIWGMPKHQASLDFVTGRKWVSSQYDLDGRMVSRFDVRMPTRFWFPMDMGAANYCTFRGMMMKSLIYFKGKAGIHLFNPSAARFVLGDHPRADVLRSLSPSPHPIFAAYVPNVRGVLDDYFESWFVTEETEPQKPLSEGLETTYGLGITQTWLAPPNRDPNFDLDKD
ncbi:MAG: acetoacetate decarboxylase family protein [Azospirillaceae bacterium]|nr:acetoacetate decarboxylase family protein [Azospirillaceae bacterium]